MIERLLKFPLSYLANEEIQQKTEWENSKYICHFEFSCSGFPHSQDKRAVIFQKKIMMFFILFLYIPGFGFTYRLLGLGLG